MSGKPRPRRDRGCAGLLERHAAPLLACALLPPAGVTFALLLGGTWNAAAIAAGAPLPGPEQIGGLAVLGAIGGAAGAASLLLELVALSDPA